ncbi:MAG: hypothetical protein RIQ55_782 [Pseudomonadota bacterium]|jgi:hypothetical protein
MSTRFILKMVAAGIVAGSFSGQFAQARDYSAQRLGAFAGAMKFCADEDGAWGDRYRDARRKVAREVDGMSRQEKSRAIEARDRAYDNGRFMGKRLDQRECRSLIRQSEWNRYR